MSVARLLTTITLVIGAEIVLLLSWLPNPVLGHYGFLPDWLAHWTDAEANDRIRTGVPFLFLGCIAGYDLVIARRNWRGWLKTLLMLTGIVFMAEAGQLILPHRSFDLGDVAWGAAGATAGLAIAQLLYQLAQFIKK